MSKFLLPKGEYVVSPGLIYSSTACTIEEEFKGGKTFYLQHPRYKDASCTIGNFARGSEVEIRKGKHILGVVRV